ncbi:MAG: hypothetical protein F9K22_00705 [Bacteroidetes bacterium]|nr:MAG: hypothetical protein F9K22_00705 [Bacteroidota bacterium]
MTAPAGRDMSELRSLITLLDDEDGEVYAAARTRLLSYREAVLPYLPASDDRRTLAAQRGAEIRETILRTIFKPLFRTMKRTASGDVDLEEGMFLIGRTRYADLDAARLTEELNTYAKELKEGLSTVSDPTEFLRRTIDFFVSDKGFTGNHADYYNEQNHYLNRVLETRRGIPITLSAVYLLVGKRIDLPLRGIGLPGHFILRMSFGTTHVYFDPFNEGAVLSYDECREMVTGLGFTFDDGYLEPVTNAQIIERMLRNIIISLERQDEKERVETIRQFIDSLSSNV